MKVTLYTQPSCGDCKMVKAYLKSKEVEFEEINIREDKKAHDKLVKANFSTTPITYIDEVAVVGFNTELLEKELLKL